MILVRSERPQAFFLNLDAQMLVLSLLEQAGLLCRDAFHFLPGFPSHQIETALPLGKPIHVFKAFELKPFTSALASSPSPCSF